jgi:hypothetical protein
MPSTVRAAAERYLGPGYGFAKSPPPFGRWGASAGRTGRWTIRQRFIPQQIGNVVQMGGRGRFAAVLLAFALVGTTACSELDGVLDNLPTAATDTGSTDRAGTATAGAAPTGDAAAALATLAVKGRAPKTGYSRDQFGAAWSDTDHNGCDQRNDVLARDMTGETFKKGTHDCVVLTGQLADPYTAKTIAFKRGQDTSDAVQIDHVVALSDAWQKGAQQLDAPTRLLLGNDPLNLMAVDGPTNQSKGDGDAATWLPPNNQYRCTYVARQVSVKAKYGLWVTQAEHDAIAGVLAGCPGQALTTDPPPPVAG